MNYHPTPVALRHAFSCLLFVSGLFWGISQAKAGSVQFPFITLSDGTTSAGIYASDGTLLRTLWSNEPTSIGPHTATWNGLDDEGIPMSPGTYSLKVLHSNVSYTWEGVLGNNSTNLAGQSVTTGENIHRSFKPTADLAISGNDMFFANGYNEGKSLFDRSVTNRPTAVSYYGPDIESTRIVNHIAADGSRFYIAQGGTSLNLASFVAAYTTSTNVQAPFTPGANETTGEVDWFGVTDLSYADKYAKTVGAAETENLTEDAIKTLSAAGRSDVIGLTGMEKAPTGIAVQPTGNFLFVSHGSIPRPSAYIQPTAYLNEIRVFNKTTGALVTTFTNLIQPGRIVADNSGIWVIAKNSSLAPIVRRYTVNATTGALTPGAEITGLSAPVALALSPNNSTLLIADSGTSQQVKAYTVSSGLPVVLWTAPLGVLGGYNAANGSTADDDKFHFFRPARIRPALPTGNETSGLVPDACLAFEGNDSFWVGDPGNERLQHFYLNKTYKDNIMFLSSTYQVSICNGDPTRIFSGWLEFSINYTAPNLQQSWKFERNWVAGLTNEEAGGGSNNKPGFGTVVKMGERVYGTSNKKLYELQSTGTTAFSTALPTSPTDHVLHEDGSLRYAKLTKSTASYFKKNFTGLVGTIPGWGPPIQMATSPITASGPVTNTGTRGEMGYKHPTTTSGLLVFSDCGDSRFHLAAVPQNGETMSPLKWRTAPSGRYFDTHGTISTQGDYPCNNAFTSGNHIILGAQGEGAYDIADRSYQANQFLHYWDNGLMVGQFGSAINYRNVEEYAQNNGRPKGVNEGRAGNAYSISMATVDGKMYFYHNDESQSSGIHRWKINNPESVGVLAPPNAPATVTLPGGSNGTGLTAQYFSGSDFNILSRSSPVADVNVVWDTTTPMPGSSDFSVRYSGLIEAKYPGNHQFTVTRGGTANGNYDRVRIWIDENSVADQWTTNGASFVTSPFSLAEGKHQILVEYSKNSSNPRLSLQWSSSLQSAQVVPFQQLYPSDARSFNFGVADLVVADNNSIGRWEPQPISLKDLGRSTGVNIDTSGVFQAAPMSVYQKTRSSGFTMGLVDLEPYAQYRVRLHLSEFTYAGSNVDAAGKRVFNAIVPDAANLGNGTGAVAADLVVKSGIDVFALAGKNKAATVDYVVSTDNAGQLKLGIANVISSPMIAGLEISRDGSATPSFAPIGAGTGLKGEYYDGDFAALVTTRVDKDVNFEWTPTNLPPVTGTTNTNYTVRWSGKVMTTKAGNYRFQIGTEDASNIKLTINGVERINTWTTAAASPESANILLAGSTQYDIVLEYKQATGPSTVNLKWKIPKVPFATTQSTLIPRSQLFNTYSAPSNPVDITVDNPAAAIVGTWGFGASYPKEGLDYRTDNGANKGTLQSVTYVPTLPEAGLYEVKTLWVGGGSRANNVPYVITHAGGTTTVTVNQTQVLAAGTWISLGSFNFNAGTAGNVSIQNTGTSPGKYVMADAVKFVKP